MTDASANVSSTVVGAQADLTSVPSTRGVNSLGYRTWSDQLSPGWLRWTVISEVGIKRAWQNRWLRRMLFGAWLPALWFGFGFFVWEQATERPEWRELLRPFLNGMPQTVEFEGLRSALRDGTEEGTRHAVWAWLLQTFFRYPQGILLLMVVGMISPPLISQDIRSRAFLIYFSRPLTRIDYLLGKLMSLWGYLAVISTLPALSLYLLGVLLSPKVSVVMATWDLPLRILGASVVLMLPTSVLALCCSSLTQESRYASFAWFAIWILGWFTYAAASAADTFNGTQQMIERRNGPMIVRVSHTEAKESPWTHLSLYHTLGRVQRWIFGFSKFEDVMWSMAILVAVTLVSLGTVYHRISAPMRI
jgi:hypothetical protein